jgi:hypothetical protein
MGLSHEYIWLYLSLYAQYVHIIPIEDHPGVLELILKSQRLILEA